MKGVVGVLGADPAPERRKTLLKELLRLGMGGVEIRADLFEDPRKALELVAEVKGAAPVLFTARNSSEGGNFRGQEAERISLVRRALQLGASWIDAEWGTGAARELSQSGAPLLVSHHDFAGTPDASDLDRITRAMEEVSAWAIKLVPTAKRLGDAVAILRWIEGGDPRRRPRVGFSMGEAGFPSRMLAMARGSPFTYGSFGAPVAPGQISAGEMLRIYRPERRTASTRVLGVVVGPGGSSPAPLILNPALGRRGVDAICLPIPVERFDEVVEALDLLGIDALRVEAPFKEEALRRSGHADPRSVALGGADFLRVERGIEGTRTLHAFNSGFAGILEPLRRRLRDLRSLPAAVIGDGGAVRSVVLALLEGGASPTIYYRNVEADGLSSGLPGVPVLPVRALRRGAFRLIVNAAVPPGKPAGPSPVAAEVFDPTLLAFETAGWSEETEFLSHARAAGAACITAGEMLARQAAEELGIFTGRSAGVEELEEDLKKGIDLRRLGS